MQCGRVEGRTATASGTGRILRSRMHVVLVQCHCICILILLKGMSTHRQWQLPWAKLLCIYIVQA